MQVLQVGLVSSQETDWAKERRGESGIVHTQVRELGSDFWKTDVDKNLRLYGYYLNRMQIRSLVII